MREALEVARDGARIPHMRRSKKVTNYLTDCLRCSVSNNLLQGPNIHTLFVIVPRYAGPVYLFACILHD